MTSVARRKKGNGTSVDPAAKAEPPKRRVTFHLLKVAELDRITDDAVAITFAVPEQLRDEFKYQPGQHLSLRLTVAGDDVRRNYSICAPLSSGKLRVGVKRLPGGVFSTYALDRLQVGDTIEVLPPTGSFTATLDPTQRKHYGALAAGSGITPILSILSSALEIEPKSRATLIYVNQSASSTMFLEELEDLKNAYLDRLQIVHVLDQERQESELLSGWLDHDRLTAILDGLVGGGVDVWYLCGPLPLTEMAREVLLARGLTDEHIHRELFHAQATPPRRPAPEVGTETQSGSEVSVVLEGRATDFKLPKASESILDAALRVRGNAPYACKNGVCGTCRAKLVEGTVEMVQNFALEQDELDRGYVLACQSYPTSDRVVLDFDA